MLFMSWQCSCQKLQSDTSAVTMLKLQSDACSIKNESRRCLTEGSLCEYQRMCVSVCPSCVCMCVCTWMWGRHAVNKRHIISTPITTVLNSVLFLLDAELLLLTESCLELWQIVELKVRQPRCGCGLVAVSNFILSFWMGHSWKQLHSFSCLGSFSE